VARTMHVTANVEKYYSNLYGRMEKINKWKLPRALAETHI
jgi:hypothetical protein